MIKNPKAAHRYRKGNLISQKTKNSFIENKQIKFMSPQKQKKYKKVKYPKRKVHLKLN